MKTPPTNKGTRLLTLQAGKELAAEIRANAAMCGCTPTTLVEKSATIMLILEMTRRRTEGGSLAVERDGKVWRFEDQHTVEGYRKMSRLRPVPGVARDEVGDVPVGELTLHLRLDLPSMKAIADFCGIPTWQEAFAYFAWRLFRLLSSVREDCPGATLGVDSSQGEFTPVFGPVRSGSKGWVLCLSPETTPTLWRELNGNPPLSGR